MGVCRFFATRIRRAPVCKKLVAMPRSGCRKVDPGTTDLNEENEGLDFKKSGFTRFSLPQSSTNGESIVTWEISLESLN